MSTKRWIAIAGIEALAIVALAASAFGASQSVGTTAAPVFADCARNDAPEPRVVMAVDTLELQKMIRTELANGMSPARKPITDPRPRDAAADQLRSSRMGWQLKEFLGRGSMTQQELDSFQRQAVLLDERDYDAAMSRLARAINQEELRVQP